MSKASASKEELRKDIVPSRPGLRINLDWALDLLQHVPGAHQSRILSRQNGRNSASSEQHQQQAAQQHDPIGMSKEELGRGTWTFLHTLAAQWPQQPSKQQKKDAKTLVDVMTRIYPCASCAAHFGTLVKRSPPTVNSQSEFQLWMCDAHNEVNGRLGKPLFNCKAAGLRWPSVKCDEVEACALN